MAIDYSSDVGRVRLRIADTDESALLLSDDQLTALLDMEDGSVKLAAAAALDTIANSEVLISKKIRTQDLSTDGPAVAQALREQAQDLRDQVDGASFGLEIVDFDPFAAYREA